ncbi:MAG: Aspartate racemase [Burkholderiaceae bacterium]|nr:Aspartate racemase [Burkholderiaceae bacterium]
MHTIGILGGMSWESTAIYYQHLNRMVRQAHGGLHSAPVIIDSVNFAQMAVWQRAGDWHSAGEFLAQKAQCLQAAGCQAIGIATNTMHKVYDTIQSQIDIPVIHIADAVCDEASQRGISRVLFLGTQFSMSDDFLRQRYAHRNIDWQVPNAQDRELVHQMIFERLCQGEVRDADRVALLDIIERCVEGCVARGAQAPQAVVLGCTELVMLLGEDTPCVLPVLDSTRIHAQALAAFILIEP